MSRNLLLVITALVAGTLLAFAGVANATVVDFDSLTWDTNLTGTGYSGITWGTSTDKAEGYTGSWHTPDSVGYVTPINGTPHSLPMCVLNWYGPDNLWFEFPTPVYFNGAWFSQAGINALPDVRFYDNLGNVSGWMTVQNTSKWLNAGFTGSTRIYVERRLAAYPDYKGSEYYLMDDVTYNAVPEPSSLLAVGLSMFMLGISKFKRSFK